jgi:hypothetical protein
MSRILRITLTTDAQFLDLTGAGKCFVRVSGADVRLAFDQFSVDNGNYFTIDDGVTLIFDQPQPFVNQPCFVRADSGTAIIEVLNSGGEF